MKKLSTIFISTLLFLGLISLDLNAQGKKSPPDPSKISIDIPVQEKFPAIEKLKEVLEIRKRMKEIEKQTIENDPELKKDFEQLLFLKKQMYDKLNEKLKDDEEYQEMKKRLEIINEKIKGKIIEGKEV
ncbi:MAG: hypothetical protein NC915_03725, partial [Candidatus Omnitrophica bacterium]|nr:hypothetical protein [Candidatus Omnitrophota bacterium]